MNILILNGSLQKENHRQATAGVSGNNRIATKINIVNGKKVVVNQTF